MSRGTAPEGVPGAAMISQKAKYAFKALIVLAQHPGETVPIEDIAERAGIPRKFLEHILLDLKARDLIASRRGRSGGYVMEKAPADITVGAVLRAVDGPIAPVPCLSINSYRRCDDCHDEDTCAVRRLFADVYAAMLSSMEVRSLADILPP